MVLWFYGFMVLWFYGFMVLWFYGFKQRGGGGGAVGGRRSKALGVVAASKTGWAIGMLKF
jgi:hypothetical protein